MTPFELGDVPTLPHKRDSVLRRVLTTALAVDDATAMPGITHWPKMTWVRVSAAPLALALVAGGHALLRVGTNRRSRQVDALVSTRTQALQQTHATLERRHRVAEGMRDVMAALNSDQPLAQVLAMIMSQSQALLGTFAGAMGQLDATSGTLCVQVLCGTPPGTEDAATIAWLAQRVQQAIEHNQPLIASTPDRRPDQSSPLLVPPQDQTAVIVAPIVVEAAGFRGALLLYYPDRQRVTSAEAELATMVAAQAALAIENAQLKAAAQEMATITERNRVARELHDSVTQSLYGIILNADATFLALTAGNADKAEQRLHQLKEIAREAMTELRLLVYELRPSILEEQGLQAALYERLEAVEMRSGIEVALEIDCVPPLPLDLQNELFWVILEGLNNIIKHARARHVQLRVVGQADRCQLTLTDDGSGFDVSTARRYGGYGLKTIGERLAQFGGTLAIHSQPGTGTTLEIEVPL